MASSSERVAAAGTAEGNPESVRDRIFKTAKELFYRQGIRAVGVEAIAAEAGTTKMSLYRHFASKDHLVAECLREQDQQFWDWWDSVIQPLEGQPRKQIEAIFTAFESLALCRERERGCPIANSAVEVVEHDHPARTIITQHHEKLLQRLRDLCRAMGARKPDELGDALLLVMNGAFLSRLVHETPGPTSSVCKAAQALIDSTTLGVPGDSKSR